MEALSDPIPRILVVEDDTELATVLQRAAAKATIELELDWAKDLRTARECIRRGAYAAVVVDYYLGPCERGDSLYAICNHYQPRARFALMSSRPLEELLNLLPGHDLPILPKPFTTSEFTGYLEALLEPDTSPEYEIEVLENEGFECETGLAVAFA